MLPCSLRRLKHISAFTEQLALAGADEIGQCIEGLMSGACGSPKRSLQQIRSIPPLPPQRAGLGVAPRLCEAEARRIRKIFIPLPAELAALAMPNAVSSVRTRCASRKRLGRSRTPWAERCQLLWAHGPARLQRKRAIELAEKGFVRVAGGAEFAHLAKTRELPAGFRHLWAIDEVWSPIPSASTAAGSRPS